MLYTHEVVGSNPSATIDIKRYQKSIWDTLSAVIEHRAPRENQANAAWPSLRSQTPFPNRSDLRHILSAREHAAKFIGDCDHCLVIVDAEEAWVANDSRILNRPTEVGFGPTRLRSARFSRTRQSSEIPLFIYSP